MSNQFLEIDRSEPILLPGEMEGWLTGNDLARFIVEVVEVLDTGRSKRRTEVVGVRPTRRRCCWRCCSTAMPKGFSPAARSSGRPTN